MHLRDPVLRVCRLVLRLPMPATALAPALDAICLDVPAANAPVPIRLAPRPVRSASRTFSREP
jgi:hypothetical protein